jgi:hypothetical protein
MYIYNSQTVTEILRNTPVHTHHISGIDCVDSAQCNMDATTFLPIYALVTPSGPETNSVQNVA